MDIFHDPRHPYTIGLLNSVPRLDEPMGRKLVPIKGTPPNLINMSDSCAFLPRCRYATEECEQRERPELRMINEHHHISCYVDVRSEE
jgi:oligopeptide/dipeptide ABC transporter ATP-binding protein